MIHFTSIALSERTLDVRRARTFPLRATLLVAALGLSLVSLPALAQDEAPKPVPESYSKAVTELLESIGADASSEQLAISMAQETLGSIAATGTEITEQIQTIVVEAAIEEFKGKLGGIEHLTGIYAPLYAEHLSEKDIRSILAFYKSESGQKMMSVLPQITQTAMYTIQQQSLEQLPGFQEKVDAKLREVGIIVVP